MLIEKNKNEMVKSGEFSKYIEHATSDNTRRAYQSDIEHFINAGFELPTNPESLASYLNMYADKLNPRTLIRKLTAIRKWHELKGEGDPAKNALVQKIMKGIARLHGSPKKQALALRMDDLEKISEYLKAQDSLDACQSRAMILLGFFGALRRSELANLKWEQVSFEKEGIVLTLLDTKTDKVGEGQKCIIPVFAPEICPVEALLDWRKASKAWEGAIFRRFSEEGELLKFSMSDWMVNKKVKQIIKAAGILNPEAYSAHSLRRGFATEAAKMGASMPSIQKHGRWKTTKTVVEYVEAGRQFEDSAIKAMENYKKR